MKPLALVIEDDEDQALIFAEALKIAGYETETILDGLTAQDRLGEVTPAIMVLDLHLPRVDGATLLKQVHVDKRLKKTRVFIASADALAAESLSQDATMVLLKPISFTQLSILAARFRPPSL